MSNHSVRTVTLLALAGSALSVSPAAALTGRPTSLRDPALAHRDYRTEAQRGLDQAPSWQDFLSRHGPLWSARWDERSHTPLRFWGSGIEVGHPANDSEALALALAFFADHEDLLGDGVTAGDLEPWANVERDGVRYVSFRRAHRGIPVEGSDAHVRVRDGRLFMGGVDTHPGIDVGVDPRVTAEEAGATADEALAALDPEGVRALVEGPDLVVLPVPREGRYDYFLAWKARIAGQEGPGLWDVFVDAVSGEVLDYRDRLMRLTGTLDVRHDLRTVPSTPELATTPMAYNQVTVGGQSVTTDGSGRFTASVSSPATLSASVNGQHIRIQNLSDGNQEITGTFEVSDGDVVEFSAETSSDTGMAQLDVYAYLLQVRERGVVMAPANGYATGRVDAKVNTSGNCNAFYDYSSINFYRSGGGCNNTGRISDVVYHEFGHGFHDAQIVHGVGELEEALSEGGSDYMAGTMWGEPYLAPYFLVGDPTPLREFDSDRRWPEDRESDPHITGLIFAGAMWDLRSLLAEHLGEEEGVALADRLYAAALATAYDIPSTYEEVLAADDDDGDLSNGTPHVCDINDAFMRHGLAPEGSVTGPGLMASHVALGNQAAGATIPVRATVSVGNPECVPHGVGGTELRWSTDGGASWQTAAMAAVGADEVAAAIPAQADGTQVLYAVRVLDGEGGIAYSSPENPAMPYHMFYVGELVPVFFDDFEGETSAWTHENLGGGAGSDDWQRGLPRGRVGDPAFAASGVKAWANDLGAAESDGAYGPGAMNALVSPPIDLQGATAARLQFRRWLSVQDGAYDRATVYVGEEPVWTSYASPASVPEAERTVHHQDLEWELHDVDILDAAGSGADVRIRFELETDGSLQMGGWTLDDVGVYARFAPDDGGEPGDDDTAGDDDTTGDDDVAGDDDTAAPGEDPDDAGSGGSEQVNTCGCQASAPPGGPPLSAAIPAGLLALTVLRRRRHG
ncbi:hypothetical protein L6R50_00995 [Myxococcota bacterium]|nr:hypothetical protein [Myxococcota bacterium]